jgi:hypothetical protein
MQELISHVYFCPYGISFIRSLKNKLHWVRFRYLVAMLLDHDNQSNSYCNADSEGVKCCLILYYTVSCLMLTVYQNQETAVTRSIIIENQQW